MGTVVRRCTRCGHHDLRSHWGSMTEAVRDEALAAAFACPRCAWPEADLIDIGASSGSSLPDLHEAGATGSDHVSDH
jgi:hypothetical protein